MKNILDWKKYLYSILILIFVIPATANASRTVSGYVYEEGTANVPVEGARVRIWDYDRASGDDLMATTTTDNNGYYRLTYGCTKGQWDTEYPGSTSWRPDIYITVAIRQGDNWVRLRSTKNNRHTNHKCRDDISDNLYVTIPSPPQPPHCDHLSPEQITCSYPWHSLYAQCTGRASDGHVYHWKHWFSKGSASQWEVEQTRCR